VNSTLNLDGILYSSAQLETESFLFLTSSNPERLKNYNIVLFGTAALVEGVINKDRVENRQLPSLNIDSEKVSIFKIKEVDYNRKRIKLKSIIKKKKYKS